MKHVECTMKTDLALRKMSPNALEKRLIYRRPNELSSFSTGHYIINNDNMLNL
jgi:hypothetical protein